MCSYWTLPSHPLPNPRTGTIVTVQAEFDPATNYTNVLRDVTQYHDARLISVDDAVNAYLVGDVTPPASTVCAALPLPFEDSVVPTLGPVDFLKRPHVRAVPIDPRLKWFLDRIIK